MELEGTTFGHYQLQRRLARGGMSEVYLAYDQSTQRTVAIKVVNRYQDDHMQRIRREVKVLGMLSHPHILPTFDYGEQGPWCYFVMPYVEQGPLRHRLLNGPLTQEEAGTILDQVASALQCAHDQGILHRDIKPANILFARKEHVYLTDFGLAREMDRRSDLTPTGCIRRTIHPTIHLLTCNLPPQHRLLLMDPAWNIAARKARDKETDMAAPTATGKEVDKNTVINMDTVTDMVINAGWALCVARYTKYPSCILK